MYESIPSRPSSSPLRVAIYCRVSSQSQEDNSSLRTQEQSCRTFAQERGWTVTGVYRDVHSGADLFDRPQLTQLREALRLRTADIVLSHALDRISRDQAHLGFLVSEWEHVGVRIELVTEEFANSPEGRLLQNVRGFMAEMERLKIRERTQRGLRDRVASGKPLVGCRPPYGYRWADAEKSRLIPDGATAPVVRRIFAAVLRGESLRRVCRDLTTDGVPTPTGRGSVWGASVIYRILTHPVYAGDATAWRHRRDKVPGLKRQLRSRPEHEHVALPGIVSEPLVSVADQAAIRTRLELNKQRATRNNHDPEATLLRAGFARCGYCGSQLNAHRFRNGSHLYRCSGTAHDRYGCPNFSMTASLLDAQVWAQITTVLRDPEIVMREVQRLRADPDATGDLHALDRQLAALAKRQQTLARLAADLSDDPDAAVPLLAELRTLAARKRTLEAERMAVEARSIAAANAAEQLHDLAMWCGRVAVNLERLGYSEKRTVLEALDVRVHVWRADHTPRWRLTMNLPLDGIDQTLEIRRDATGETTDSVAA